MAEEGKSRISAPFFLTLEFLLAFILAVYLLYKYGNIRKQNPLVIGFTLIIWFLSFVIIFLLPVDVSSVSVCVCVWNVFSRGQSLPYGIDIINRILISTSFPTQAFYQLCLSDKELDNKSHDCSEFVCSGSKPEYLTGSNNSELCYECFQPYSFVCPLPLKILWYIIYWLFFILSW